MAEARAAARQAKEDEKTRRSMEREEKKLNRQIARNALWDEQTQARKDREAREVAMNRPGRSPSRPRIDPEDLAAAAEAALGKPKAKAKAKGQAKASVAEVTAMALEKFGKCRAKAKAAAKKQPKDTIRRVPVVKDAKRAGRIKGSRNKLDESAAIAAA
jgi:hypothetical protein